ncbi:MAG: ABC transporter permease [Deferribacterales bacterium]
MLKRIFSLGLLPVSAAVILRAFQYYPADTFSPVPPEYYERVINTLITLFLLTWFMGAVNKSFAKWWNSKAPLITLGIFIILLWDFFTSKTGRLPLPYFPGPDRVIAVFVEDQTILVKSVFSSVRLMVLGFLIGSAAGIASGSLLGWSAKVSYWLSPVVRIFGPVPATAWIPVCMIIFPNSFQAGVFLVALAVWFPVTLMTASGIYNVPKSYYEAAAVLGTDSGRQFFRVAVPAALPAVFTGQFMGVSASFLVLITAEMTGSSSGLGWYIVWSIGWAAYAKMYASLLISAVIFSGAIKVLFLFRDRLMSWQPSTVRW